MAIGKKGNDALEKENQVISNQSNVFEDLTFENVAKIADTLMAQFESGAVDKIELVYNKFKNAATQIILTEPFLPIVPNTEIINLNQDYTIPKDFEKSSFCLHPLVGSLKLIHNSLYFYQILFCQSVFVLFFY